MLFPDEPFKGLKLVAVSSNGVSGSGRCERKIST